jgi:hypothetical protein
MENWGLVTYKDSLLLFDEKTSGVEDKKRVAYGKITSPAFKGFGEVKSADIFHSSCAT